uniref:Alpha-1,3-glucosyltransferase n=1 Tax=Timema cristinae TaxID=61476 RepID=A0A7R9CNQ2_TIMCR|nr:unnamed protein product [Timema cristinae]
MAMALFQPYTASGKLKAEMTPMTPKCRIATSTAMVQQPYGLPALTITGEKQPVFLKATIQYLPQMSLDLGVVRRENVQHEYKQQNFVDPHIISAILIRWCVSLHSYSGSNKPPLYGDYEAQRHWMEVTYNLPLSDWYHNTTNNDLMYWGLDYPPLTAYHSYLCGWVASLVNPNYVAIHSSRGIVCHLEKLRTV